MELRRSFSACALLTLLASAAAAQETAPPAEPATAAPAESAEAPEVAEQLGRGNALFEAGQTREALAAFSEAERLAGGRSFAAALGVANAHFRAGTPKLARTAAERAVALARDDRERSSALNLLGLAWYHGSGGAREDLEKAVAPLEQDIALAGPSQYSSRFVLARVRDALGEPQAAVDTLRGLLAALPAKHATAKEGRILLCHIRFRNPGIGAPQGDPPPAASKEAVVNPQPIYDQSTALKGAVNKKKPHAGPVRLHAVIDREGCVKNIEKPSNVSPETFGEAHQMLSQWVFLPATVSGVPVAVSYTLTANFNAAPAAGKSGSAN